MNKIYTIGYSGFEINEFISTLKEHGISCVIDVRSLPNSAYYPDYNEVMLKQKLQQEGIIYRNYAREFGARQDNRAFYTKGVLDFEKFTKSDVFASGMRKIEKGVAQGYSFVLMCAEKDPINCHRNIMIAHEFQKKGYEVINILPKRTIEPQADLENRLLDLYFPNRDQISFFSEENRSYYELVSLAYKKRSEEIGYRLGEEQENSYECESV